ncbi:MAG: hypothetical protein AAF633_14235 [Chloroflexota bacterium]
MRKHYQMAFSLGLKLEDFGANNGWIIHISPSATSVKNYAGVVTPPFYGTNALKIYGWHFRNANNTGPNDGSVNAPQERRVFYFVLNEKDYQTAFDALQCILRNQCDGTDVEAAYDLQQSLSAAGGELVIQQIKFGAFEPNEDAWIESLAFEVKLYLPED